MAQRVLNDTDRTGCKVQQIPAAPREYTALPPERQPFDRNSTNEFPYFFVQDAGPSYGGTAPPTSHYTVLPAAEDSSSITYSQSPMGGAPSSFAVPRDYPVKVETGYMTFPEDQFPPPQDPSVQTHSTQSFSPSLSNDCTLQLSPQSEENVDAPKRAASAPGEGRKKPRRKTHNAIEKRYRTRLNDKITELRDSIPSLRMRCGENSGGENDPNAQKVNKANILEKATEYVKFLEDSNRRLQIQLHYALQKANNRTWEAPTSQQPKLRNPESSGSVTSFDRDRYTTQQSYTAHDLMSDDAAMIL